MVTKVRGSVAEDYPIYVGSVAEMEALSLPVGANVYLTEEGRAGEFVVVAGLCAPDPKRGIFMNLANGNCAKRLYADAINIRWFGATGDGVTDDQPAIQAAFDSLEQYSQDTQNSGAFQRKVEVMFPEGDYILETPVVKKYRNSMRLSGPGRLKASTTFTGAYLLELIACSHVEIIGLQFHGNSFSAKSAMRLSGDGSTGTKRNSTNIKVHYCFFRDFGATGTNSYVVDTLSPNGVPGDYSIDDSEFIGCNWLGSYGGGLRVASSTIKIDGGKFSFIGIDETLPIISLGNGTTAMISDVTFTASPTTIIKADDGAYIGNVKIDGCYLESSSYPMYSQSGGSNSSVCITGGFFGGVLDSNSTFVLFSNQCKGNLQLSGTAFQNNAYTTIDLGESGSYIGDVQTNTTSVKSYYPKVKNGIFSERKTAIQTTQDINKKRLIDAKYDQVCDLPLQLFVGATDDFTRLRFTSLDDALRYVDQSGYTECEIQIPAGTCAVTKPYVLSGEVVIIGAGDANTTLDINFPLICKNGTLKVQSATIDYIDGAIQNRGGTVNFIGCNLTGPLNTDFLVVHYSGNTVFTSCDFVTAGSGVRLNDNQSSSGRIVYNNQSFTNIDAKSSSVSTTLCRTIYVDIAAPTRGFWQRGAIQESNEVNSGAVMQRVCTFSGQPGAWKATITAAA